MARWGRVVVAVVTAGLCLAPGGTAAPTAARRTVNVSVNGSLTYVWHGDPAQGCGPAGACSLTGAVTYRITGGELTVVKGHEEGFSYGSGPATIRVRRDMGSGAPQECVDLNNGFLDLNFQQTAGGAELSPQLESISERCAGPLPGDLANLDLSGDWSGSHHRTLDLHESRPFTAGPFSGRLISTLVVHREPRGFGSSTVSNTYARRRAHATPRHATPPKRRLFEELSFKYAVDASSSTTDVSFQGDPGPFCETLDDCGARGRLIVSVPVQHTTLIVSAFRRVPTRRTPRQVIRDFRTDPGSFEVTGYGTVSGTTHEKFHWPGGPTCQDTTATPAAEQFGPLALNVNGGRHGATVTLQQVQGDALRTHCPGPGSSQILGGYQSVLVRGRITPRALLSRRSTLELTGSHTFSGQGYSGRQSGDLRLGLRLLKSRAVTRAEP